MNTNEKKEEQIKVLNEAEEQLEENQLESVEGGATECTCDCWIGNSNHATPSKPTTTAPPSSQPGTAHPTSMN